MSKRLLLINRAGPFADGRAKAALDMALSAAVFEQEVFMLYMGDAVFQLLAEQPAELINRKSTSAALSALPLYGIDKVYIDKSALLARGLEDAKLALEAEMLDSNEMANLLKSADVAFAL
jgi:tRNA 2-thiouridine synthesizing protein C